MELSGVCGVVVKRSMSTGTTAAFSSAIAAMISLCRFHPPHQSNRVVRFSQRRRCHRESHRLHRNRQQPARGVRSLPDWSASYHADATLRLLYVLCSSEAGAAVNRVRGLCTAFVSGEWSFRSRIVRNLSGVQPAQHHLASNQKTESSAFSSVKNPTRAARHRNRLVLDPSGRGCHTSCLAPSSRRSSS